VLRPLDTETIIASVSKTRRCVIIDEGWKSGSLSAEIGMRIAEEAFFDLDAALPQPIEIVAAARSLVRPGKTEE
jgi:pyruvate dehydrogenase E1 component beta subunit